MERKPPAAGMQPAFSPPVKEEIIERLDHEKVREEKSPRTPSPSRPLRRNFIGKRGAICWPHPFRRYVE